MPASRAKPNASTLDIADHDAVIGFCRTNKVDFVVVGPDAPIAAGIVDDLNAAGFKAFGPTKAAGQLESSKSFTKALCRANNIPTAGLRTLRRRERGKSLHPRAGRADRGQGRRPRRRQGRRGGDDGSGSARRGRHDVRRRLWRGRRRGRGRGIPEGEEASFFALCDGEHALPLATAQDHKRAFDGDKGPNTGGMGAYSPAPVMTRSDLRAGDGRDDHSDAARAGRRWARPTRACSMPGSW